MKLVKKIMAGALSLAVIAAAMFAFVGCNGVSGNEYAYKSLTFTIVTELEDASKAGTKDAVIKTTRTLSAREFYMFKEEGVALENLATATTEATDEAILKWCEEYVEDEIGGEARTGLEKAKETTLNFKSNKLEMIKESEPDKNTGDKSRDVTTGKYTVKDGLIEVVVDNTMDIYPDGMSEYEITYFNVVGENVEKQITLLTEATQYSVEGLLSFSIVFSEV